MDIHLHLGAHRTGTTTFQFFLRNNREVLAQNGIAAFFPNETRIGMLKGIMGNPLADGPRKRQEAREAIPKFRNFLQEVKADGYKHLILSEENLLGSLRRNFHRGVIYPNATGQLRFLARALQDYDVRILLTMRSYDTYWSSALNYVVRWGEKVPARSKIAGIAATRRTWRDVGRGIGNAFPEAAFKVRPFEMFASRPMVQLEALLGEVPPPGLKAQTRWHHRTESLSDLRTKLRDRGDLAGANALPSRGEFWAPFSKAQVQDMRCIYQNDVQWARNLNAPHKLSARPDLKGWTNDRQHQNVA